MSLLATETVEVARTSGRVVEALETTRRAMARYRKSMAFVAAALIAMAIASVVAVADVSWVLPGRARAVALLVMILTAAGVVAKSMIAPGRKFGRSEAAAEVESAFPELGQRVRTTLEYAEPTATTAPASRSLIGALNRDTDRRTGQVEFPTVVPWSTLNRRVLGLVAAIAAILIALAYDANLRIAAQRLVLRPVHYTTIEVKPGDQTLKEGSDFTLKATLAGRPVLGAQWLRRPAGTGEAWTSAPLATPIEPGQPPRALIGTIEAVRKDCRADFEYQVVAGDVESPVFRVTVTHPLALKSFAAAIEPPAYTRLKPTVAREGNFKVPEGSKVKFQIALDRVPIMARIVWTPEGSKSPQTLTLAINENKLSGELPNLDKDVHYELIASAADGMKLDSSKFLIKVQPDEKPSIKFIKPDESYAATPTTEIPLKVETVDDYGVAKVGIAYRVGDGPKETLYLGNPEGQPLTVETLATLYLEKHELTYTDSLTYHAFVEDNRAPGAHRSSTELRFIDILPYKKEFQLTEGGGTCNGSSVSLEELIARQRRALNRAFAHESDSPVDPKVADRLHKEEAEIARVAAEFAQGLTSQFGAVSPLDEAAQAIESACVALGSRDIQAAIPLEQSALTALIKARKNLRKLLTDSSSAGLCRKFDRQQQQKIRKPPADKPQEAELAKLEADIKKLAEEQKRFAEEIDPKGGGGAELDKKAEPKAGKASKTAGSKPSPSDRQQASAKEADRLKALTRQDQALTDLARARMDEAAKQVKDAEGQIQGEKNREAAQAARLAAAQLERLAEQVAALKAKELAARVAKARDLAQAMARDEHEQAQNQDQKGENRDEALARQQKLAEEAKTLDDLLKRIKDDAAEEDRTLAQAVDKASNAHSPAEIEQAIQRARALLAAGDRANSSRSMADASGKLDALARDLETARREFTQPKLQQLLAAEKQAADVQKALESASSEARKAEAEKELSELAKAVNSLKAGDGPLRKAADALAQANQLGQGAGGWTPPSKAALQGGLFTPPIAYTNAVRDISKALQAKIQELILNDALVDRDGAVPPGYKEKVEDYFRILSEDLR